MRALHPPSSNPWPDATFFSPLPPSPPLPPDLEYHYPVHHARFEYPQPHDATSMHSTTTSLSLSAAAFIHDNTITSTVQSAEIAWPTLCAIFLSNAAGAEAAIKARPPS
jgi:hypothetical protein